MARAKRVKRQPRAPKVPRFKKYADEDDAGKLRIKTWLKTRDEQINANLLAMGKAAFDI